MHIEEAIVTRGKIIIILNALVKFTCSLFNNAHILTGILEQPFLKQGTGYITEIKPLISFKTSEIFVYAVKNVVCWQYKTRNSTTPDVPPGQLLPFRHCCLTNFAI
jgi:hypothetical protein